jgi:radical SAM superfamily enzyme YgiQ (UPF0313 family)
MVKVYSSQFNYLWGDQIHFPYSVGMLVSYMKTKPNLKSNFEFEKTFIFRHKIEDYISKCNDAEILLCSCYVWNWQITIHLAEEVKKKNPNCMIIFGGPQTPDNDPDFFKKYPFIDMIVHGEGEYVIANIFDAYLKNKDFSQIKGVETKDFKNEWEARIKDLESLPSPYLNETIWDLTEKNDNINYLASWESNRGCPYPCTYCDWGSMTAQKISTFSEERLFKEIEWFGDNKIIYIDSCDANFGIFQEKDFKLAKKLSDVALEKHYPQRVRLSWAKFSSEKIIPLAKELQRSDLLRAVTLALQSLDETTLDLVKRANIKFDNFSKLTDSFRENKIPTYTEMIMGMPGETVESWKKGLEILASDAKIDSIYVYNCTVLPNAPMNDPNYKKMMKIKTISSPIYLPHASIHDNESIPEIEQIISETLSCDQDGLKQMFIHSWFIVTFHSLGLLEYVSKFYKKLYKIGFMDFYDSLLEFCQKEESIFSKEYEIVRNYVDEGYAGKGWNHSDPKLGDIYWTIEEASWLRSAYDKQKLKDSCVSFMRFLENKYKLQTSEKTIEDLINFQIFLLTTREDHSKIKSFESSHNWKEFFTNNLELENCKKMYSYSNKNLETDPIEWAYKTIWFGRYSTKYKCHPEFLEEIQNEIQLN